jgi:hypothetical protein
VVVVVGPGNVPCVAAATALLLGGEGMASGGEPLCDDWAIARDISPVTLARCLTQVAGWCARTPNLIPAATNGPSQLTYRVERLLCRDATAVSLSKRRALPIVFSAFLLLAFTPLVRWSQAETPTSNINPFSEPVHVKLEDKTLAVVPVTVPPMELPSEIAAVDRIPADITEDLNVIQSDLQLALELLDRSEDDPEIREAVFVLMHRLERLRQREGFKPRPVTSP